MSFPSGVKNLFHCLGKRACFLLLRDQGDLRLTLNKSINKLNTDPHPKTNKLHRKRKPIDLTIIKYPSLGQKVNWEVVNTFNQASHFSRDKESMSKENQLRLDRTNIKPHWISKQHNPNKFTQTETFSWQTHQCLNIDSNNESFQNKYHNQTEWGKHAKKNKNKNTITITV